jgi:hypothetical protein
LKIRIIRIKAIVIFIILLLFFPTINVFAIYNHPPSTPIIKGPINGILGETYPFYINSNDSDGDDIYYYIKWGDCMVEYNNGPYQSGEEILFYHSFCEICCGPGDFYVCVQAIDEYGERSEWGILIVTMSKTKLNYDFSYFIIRLFNNFYLLENLYNLDFINQ